MKSVIKKKKLNSKFFLKHNPIKLYVHVCDQSRKREIWDLKVIGKLEYTRNLDDRHWWICRERKSCR